jgi:hypothetical protein
VAQSRHSTLRGGGDAFRDSEKLAWPLFFVGTLGLKHEYFFTYAINGCGFMIGGTPPQPIVAHANLDSKRLDQVVAEASERFSHEVALRVVKKEQALIYDQFYSNLAAGLIDQGYLAGARIEVVTPEQYLVQAGAGYGAVFGINRGGKWEIYGNWAKKTMKIWP